MATIFRQPTEAEKKDFKVLGAQDIEEKFKEEIIKHEQEAVKKGAPFAAQVVLLDYNGEINRQAQKIMRETGNGFLNDEDIAKIKMPEVDWEKYSDLKNFKLIGEEPVLDKELSKHHKMSINVKSKTYQYKGYSYIYTVQEDGYKAVERAEDQRDERRAIIIPENTK